MKTIRIALDESLLHEIDCAVDSLGTTRSAFTRNALRASLVDLREWEFERRAALGSREDGLRLLDELDRCE